MKLIVLAVAAALVAACGSGGSGESESEVTKIGVVMSSTGAASSKGEFDRRGVELYEHLHADDENLEFVYADDKSDPGEAVAAVNRMLAEDQVDAVICCTTTPASLAVREPLEQQGTLQVSVAASADIVEPAGERPFSFKTPYTDYAVQKAAVEDMKANDVSTVAILRLDDSYGESGEEALQEAAAEVGIEVVASASFARDATDVTAQVQSLQRAQPDAYVVWAILPSANVAQKVLVDTGVTVQVYHSFGVTDPAFIELGGDSVEGVKIAAGRLVAHQDVEGDDEESQVIRDFAEAYRTKFSEEVTAFSGFGYDAAGLLSRAAADAGDGEGQDFREELRDVFESISDYVGTTGTFTYSADDHTGIDHGSLGIVVVKDGRFTGSAED